MGTEMDNFFKLVVTENPQFCHWNFWFAGLYCTFQLSTVIEITMVDSSQSAVGTFDAVIVPEIQLFTVLAATLLFPVVSQSLKTLSSSSPWSKALRLLLV